MFVDVFSVLMTECAFEASFNCVTVLIYHLGRGQLFSRCYQCIDLPVHFCIVALSALGMPAAASFPSHSGRML